jgi:hypothetical protein
MNSTRLNELIGQYGLECSKSKELAPTTELAEGLKWVAQIETDLALAQQKIKSLTSDRDWLRGILNCRAGRLLLWGKPFFVVTTTEPYARQVMELIKAHQGEKWTAEDEKWAQDALDGAWKKGRGWDK